MKRSILIVGLVVVSLILVLACARQEEPAKAQKSEAEKKSATEQKHAVEQTASAAKAVPAQKGAEYKEHQATHEHQKPEPAKADEKQGQKSEINQALLDYLAKTGDDPKYANPHQTAEIDLNDDGRQDALVLLENPIYFCGTGGCTMLVFKGTKSGFEFVSRSSLIRGPVLVSETKTHGWRDLIMEVSGGGVAPKQVACKYTGSQYPLNPSTLPPLPKNQPSKGTKIF
jgi:hypothetical protein